MKPHFPCNPTRRHPALILRSYRAAIASMPLKAITRVLPLALAVAASAYAADAPKVKQIRFENTGNPLSIAELKVMAGGANIAMAGTATQSTTMGDAAAIRAIDGNTDGDFAHNSVTHTAPGDAAPWWELTLPEPKSIDQIEIWNRTQVATERMDGARLIVLGEGGNKLAQTVLQDVQPSVRYHLTGNQLEIVRPNLLADPKTSFASVKGEPAPYLLHYNESAPIDLKGWETQSLPLGNGYFGVSFFGGAGEECWQFTDKSYFVNDDQPGMSNGKPSNLVGLSDLLDLRLTMDHGTENIAGYGRELELDRAIGRTRYIKDGVEYRRELFTSYPDRVFASRITASKPGKLSFRLRAVQPYLGENRSGTAEASGSQIIVRGIGKFYQVAYEVRIAVKTAGGTVTSWTEGSDGVLQVAGADKAEVYVTLGTSYQLSPNIFLEANPVKKLQGNAVPSERITKDLASAMSAGFDPLMARHIADHQALFNRADVRLGGKPGIYLTDKLLADSQKTPPEARYLEELYFQFGRYLLIASSRKGTLPANLQGTWNMNRTAPWSGGYWANINIQMNYWPAFVTGLEETFSPYWDFFHAAFPQAQKIAASTLKGWNAEKAIDDGWTAGTGNSPYYVSGPGRTSGAGTGPFVLLPLWDWYLFTGDKQKLEEIWPMMISSCRFLAAALKLQPDGIWLCDPSWSPENKPKDGPHVQLPGTAYDQQLVYENYRMALEAARILGKDDTILETVRKQMPLLSPIQIGTSGQLKEFRQEQAYGEYGEPHHRHISQLIGLYPATLITEKKEWMNAAKVSLNMRGDQSTGWAMAHRLNAWARLGDGDRAHKLLRTLLSKGTLPNLWDTHPPFQIDGNFGGTSGIAEMLLQSHNGMIYPLPALPKAWETGSFRGLRARGGMVVSAEWNEAKLASLQLDCERGGPCRVVVDQGWKVLGRNGKEISSAYDSTTGCLGFSAQQGESYRVSGKNPAPSVPR